jgi:hypothetical protein
MNRAPHTLTPDLITREKKKTGGNMLKRVTSGRAPPPPPAAAAAATAAPAHRRRRRRRHPARFPNTRILSSASSRLKSSVPVHCHSLFLGKKNALWSSFYFESWKLSFFLLSGFTLYFFLGLHFLLSGFTLYDSLCSARERSRLMAVEYVSWRWDMVLGGGI